MYKIYKHTLPDGRAYIGYTGLEKGYQRWQYGAGYRNIPLFFEAILQYGWDNIKHEILEEVETKEEALEREWYYIDLYKTHIEANGFNKNKAHRKETKKKVIRCVETNEEFETLRAAGAAIGRTPQAISYAILNKKPCAKMHWEYAYLDC